ncbi:HlyD family secretion protein [Aneurinibacillus tyrosinisolvens]|uniref:HlyD family secretion protein n=1 Tax=Aneurinibacillus tyrosinisolvens TaxID=1443435 RepID=UPI00069C705A|nr:efflux RND transporter periplasmic adaptor subunit [Aneurinibacillus tyrosinisolvens]
MRKKASVLLLFVSILLTACQGKSTVPVYSGTIEGKEMLIQSELGGALKTAAAEEGHEVKANETVAQLNNREYIAKINEAKAAVESAQAKLEEAGAGTRTQKIKEAQARVNQSEATVAQSEAKIRSATAQLPLLEANLSQLQARAQGAESTLAYHQKRLQQMKTLLEQGAASPSEADAVREAVNQALTVVNDFKNQATSIRAQMNQAKEEIAADEAARSSNIAARQAAQADLDLLKEGETNYTVRYLLGQKDQAESRLKQAAITETRTQVRSPEAGVILRKHVNKGEVVKPGATLYTLLRKGILEVVVYIPEAELGGVSVGQQASITVDAYPNRAFKGKVTRIAREAEFTPKNVQTPDERTKMVFAVTVNILDGLGMLKPGMPADITFVPVKAGGK